MIDLILSFIPAGWLAAIVAGVGVIWAAWGLGGRGNAVRAEKRGLEDAIKGHEVRNEVENRIDRDGAPADRLRERWGRD